MRHQVRQFIPISLLSCFALMTCISLVSAQNEPPPPARLEPDSIRVLRAPQTNPSQNFFQQNPNSEERQRLRALNQLRNTARQFEFMGQHERALDLYGQMYETDPDDRQAFEGIRRNLSALGRYEEVERLIRAALADEVPWASRTKLLAELGGVLWEAGELNRADSAWTAALEVAPPSERNFQEVAGIQLRLHLVDRATITYLAGRKKLDDPLLFSVQMAGLYTASMNWKAAAQEYLTTLRINNMRVHYVRRGLANFPDNPDANKAVLKSIQDELKDTRGKEPWNGHRIQLYELLIDQRTKNADFANALEAVAALDELEHGNGDRLLRFASQTLDEGYGQVASQALDLAAERLRDPEGADVVDLMRAQIAQSLGEYLRADSLLSLVADDPASARVERSALMSRGLIRLQQLDQPLEAAADFRIVRTMGWPENDRRLDYYEAVALIRTDSLEAAIIPLQREIPQEKLDDSRSFGFVTESGVVGDTDLNHLAARILLWTGKREQASTLLDSLLNPPVGASAENETLLLLHLITTSQDSIALDLFADADYAEFRGDTQTALTLLDSLALNENTPEQLAVEADFSAAMLRLAESDSAGAIVEFANRHPDHPRVEEAWYQLGLWWESKGNYTEAAVAYEMVLMDFPDGLLQSLARLRLEELTVQLLMPDLPAEDL